MNTKQTKAYKAELKRNSKVTIDVRTWPGGGEFVLLGDDCGVVRRCGGSTFEIEDNKLAFGKRGQPKTFKEFIYNEALHDLKRYNDAVDCDPSEKE